jgi:iron complex transport system substrate-binding protein
MVFGLQEGAAQVAALSRFSIPVELLNHSALVGIKSSYTVVAERCGVVERARARLAEFAEREAAIRTSCAAGQAGRARLRIMVVVGRTREGGLDSGVYLSGSDGFYSEIVSLLGGINVHDGRTIAVPTISSEGILKLAPDIIVDIVNVDDRAGVLQARRFWDRFPNLPAVRRGKVIVLSDDFASIPGPRYILLAEKLAGAVCGLNRRIGSFARSRPDNTDLPPCP